MLGNQLSFDFEAITELDNKYYVNYYYWLYVL